MPDDDIKVAEQQEKTTILVEEEGKPDTLDESGFSDAFSEALGKEEVKPSEKTKDPGEKTQADAEKKAEDEEAASEKEKVAKVKAEKKIEAEKAGVTKKDNAKAEKKAAEEKATEESGKEKTEDELAEDRGREILAAEEKATEEAEEKTKKEKKDLADAEATKAAAEPAAPMTKDQITNFISMIPASELPDEIEIGDQTYNVKDYVSEYPEAQVVSGFVTQKILERLVNNGVLMTVAQHNEKIADIEDRMFGLYFDFSVLQKIPDAMEIVETKEYKTWVEKTATKEDLALLGSNKPNDYILGLKRYMKGAPVAPVASEAAKKAAAAKAKTQKDLHDGIHSLTMEARPGKDDLSASMEARSDEFSSAFKEAEEKAEKEDK